MAKTISKKSVEAINARCRNGFRFDLQNFMERGEKRLCRSIMLKENEKLVKLTLWWQDETIYRKNQYGCTIREYTGNVVPELHCAVWRKSEASSFWVSLGFGGFHPFNEHPSSKRLMNALADATALVTDGMILSLLPGRERAEYQQIIENQNKTE
ncbi:MAG: hypothetical protein LUC96_10405 [Alistipes sp.]|uniref:hypothetical protein n=1 Tax=Alistipes sp. TaxID=1872444 RepID=UPI0025C6D0F7|nr:hypothetical protein [Alistipes sp.]MCD7793847.1 hypothetical protein [Alistipes sp.]MCD8275375.1 hypothetical protein [Alistipes sp.]